MYTMVAKDPIEHGEALVEVTGTYTSMHTNTHFFALRFMVVYNITFI